MSEENFPFPWPRDLSMTGASRILAGPLVFGDEVQLAAKRYMDALQDARVRLLHCKQCGGVGERPQARGHKFVTCECIQEECPQIRRDLGV